MLETDISPELIPADGDGDEPGSTARSDVGPYELQDFFLYYIAALRLPPEQGRLPGPARLGRPHTRASGPT